MKKENEFNLNPKQAKFCEEYIVDLNGKQAAIRAGYSEKTAENQASRLLSIDKVKEYISFLKGQREKRTEITADMVIKDIQLAREMSLGLKPHKVVLKDSVGDGITQHIEQEMHKTDLPMFVKLTELQMRHLGMFEKDNKVELVGKVVTMLPQKNKDN